MIIKGEAFKFQDNINTDYIISGRYKFSITDMRELSKYIFEDIRPSFWREIQNKSPIIVAGVNFGCGSSREQAPLALKEAGIRCIVAKSFARIFYRNCFNIGLPLIEADTSSIDENDRLEILLNEGRILNITKKQTISFTPLPQFMQMMLKEGGVINLIEKFKGWPE